MRSGNDCLLLILILPLTLRVLPDFATLALILCGSRGILRLLRDGSGDPGAGLLLLAAATTPCIRGMVPAGSEKLSPTSSMTCSGSNPNIATHGRKAVLTRLGRASAAGCRGGLNDRTLHFSTTTPPSPGI